MHHEEIPAEVHPAPEVHHYEPEVKDSKAFEYKQEPLKHEHPEEPKVAEHRTSETESEAKPASFLRKAIYLAGIGVLLYVAVAMFRNYNAKRKERIQKRLY